MEKRIIFSLSLSRWCWDEEKRMREWEREREGLEETDVQACNREQEI